MAKEGVANDLILLGEDYEFELEGVDEDFFHPLDEGIGYSGEDNAPTTSKRNAQHARVPLKLTPMA
jgi:hypothetical protein